MDKLKGIINEIVNGNSKVRLVVTGVFSIFLVSILLLGSTYSLFSTSNVDEDLNVYKTGNLDITYTLSSDNIKLTNSTPISLNDSVYIEPYRITINNSGNVPYMFDLILNDSTATDVIDYEYVVTQVGKLDAKKLSECSNNVIKEDIVVLAGESVNVDVRVFLSDNIKNTEIGKSFYAKLSVDGLAVYNEEKEIDNSILIADVMYDINKPNLDTGLIPVYYDKKNETWKKADNNNIDNSWYDYSNKKWANAVLINDSDKRDKYLNSDINTIINEDDVTGYFVWIPRFKYNVWNINRTIGNEEEYSYNAYSNGIRIKWEKDTNNTGNVECIYDLNVGESDKVLSDKCVYNDASINVNSKNVDYVDSWYTHPAFTVNGQIDGFWVGKFETTGSINNPLVIPNSYSFRDLSNISLEEQYNIVNKFYDYGLTKLKSMIANNLEWGAITYLTHSNYGVCNDKKCSEVISNNSYYTGMSFGNGDNNSYGKYNYKGYIIDNDTGKVTDSKDVSKLASTTGNITGIYDMNGGASELVLGEMIKNNNDRNISRVYYSYGTSFNDKKAYNRTRLGDATTEFVGVLNNDSDVISENYNNWLRGGNINSASIFKFNRYSGVWNKDIGAVTVRTVLK